MTKGCVVSVVLIVLFAFEAYAWMTDWAPEIKATPANVTALSCGSVSNFICKACGEDEQFRAGWSKGGTVDLNGDGVDDYVYIIPWMGNGLNAEGYDAHFVVSAGTKGKVENIIEGYGMEMADIVKSSGKTYFRHSAFFNKFEKSNHNHWVYQMYSFGTNGVMKFANADFGKQFPAATIYYINPKFKRVELTPSDLKKIADGTMPKAKKH